MKELLYIFFYLFYFIEWLVKLCFYKNAYRNISFEREAYNNENIVGYDISRKPYAWIKHITKK